MSKDTYWEILEGLAISLRKALITLGVLKSMQMTPEDMLKPPVVPEPAPKRSADLLHAFCLAIQVYEGYIIPGGKDSTGLVYPFGSPAYRNKNPGNLRCSVGDRANWNHLAVSCTVNNFCVFPTYEVGFQALVNVTLNVARAGSNLYNQRAHALGLDDCGEMDLVQYFTVRDPSSDGNNPRLFAEFMARQIGVDISTFRMKHLL